MSALTVSDYKVLGRIGLNQAIDAVSSTQSHPLGERIVARDVSSASRPDGEFIYLKGITGTAVGSWVMFDDVGVTALLDTDVAATKDGQVAVAMAAVDANTKYGWYQIKGVALGLVAASFADNAKVFPTSTAGTADDAAVAGCRINGAKSGSAIDDNSLAEVELNYPQVENQVAADLILA